MNSLEVVSYFLKEWTVTKNVLLKPENERWYFWVHHAEWLQTSAGIKRRVRNCSCSKPNAVPLSIEVGTVELRIQLLLPWIYTLFLMYSGRLTGHKQKKQSIKYEGDKFFFFLHKTVLFINHCFRGRIWYCVS